MFSRASATATPASRRFAKSSPRGRCRAAEFGDSHRAAAATPAASAATRPSAPAASPPRAAGGRLSARPDSGLGGADLTAPDVVLAQRKDGLLAGDEAAAPTEGAAAPVQHREVGMVGPAPRARSFPPGRRRRAAPKVRRSTIAAQSRGSEKALVQPENDSLEAMGDAVLLLAFGQGLEEGFGAATVEFQ